jgi:hypothetical protein
MTDPILSSRARHALKELGLRLDHFDTSTVRLALYELATKDGQSLSDLVNDLHREVHRCGRSTQDEIRSFIGLDSSTPWIVLKSPKYCLVCTSSYQTPVDAFLLGYIAGRRQDAKTPLCMEHAPILARMIAETK